MPKGESRTLATDPKHRWIDHVALGPDGAVAWSAGKTAFAQAKELREFEAPSTVGGLAFLPKGFRLAVAHYNGATLWFPNAPQAAPEMLEWKGSHLGATVSPDGRFLVTTMQEPMLHGWRLADRKHMRMSGYAARVTSLGWTAGGDWLATSGAPQLILWPFQGKTGRWARAARVGAVGAPRRGRRLSPEGRSSPPATATAWCSCASRTAPRFGQKPGKAPVSALAWSADGRFSFGTEAAKPAYRSRLTVEGYACWIGIREMIFSENRIPLSGSCSGRFDDGGGEAFEDRQNFRAFKLARGRSRPARCGAAAAGGT